MFSSNASQVSSDQLFVEDIFSCTLYTGTGASQTINNGIDLAGEGGLAWVKLRSSTASHYLVDTVRGPSNVLSSNSTAANSNIPTVIPTFNSNGFNTGGGIDISTQTYASWTFRKQPKFFDVVTWTSQAGANTVAHNLGSAPGFIVMKSLANPDNWWVYHRSLGNDKYIVLNQTSGSANSTGFWNTSTTTFGYGNGIITAGEPMVAYIYAHDAGGFGLTGTDNVISCGSFTAGTGSVNLGYEPQWIMFKGLTGSNGWIMFDTMRGWPTEPPNKLLQAQTSAVEGDTFVNCQPTATGFNYNFSPDCIYIAIRRGPMKVPTDGTKVFAPVTQAAAGTVTTDFPVDLAISSSRTSTGSKGALDRLRGSSTNSYAVLFTNGMGAEGTGTGAGFGFDNNTGYVDAFWSSSSIAYWNFRRAPGFFDEVCYTGTGSARTVAHNLAAVPELMIVKNRVEAGGERWTVYSSFLTATKAMYLDGTNAGTTASVFWNNTEPTASVFSVGTAGNTNTNTQTYVAYLFATCPGVSKVGSYTGTGTTQTINCGFAAGARFVLIKRTDSTGDWYVWDSARGMVSGTDPSLLLNSTAAEVTSTDYIDPVASGFEISSTAPAAINASGGSYIFWAVA